MGRRRPATCSRFLGRRRWKVGDCGRQTGGSRGIFGGLRRPRRRRAQTASLNGSTAANQAAARIAARRVSPALEAAGQVDRFEEPTGQNIQVINKNLGHFSPAKGPRPTSQCQSRERLDTGRSRGGGATAVCPSAVTASRDSPAVTRTTRRDVWQPSPRRTFAPSGPGASLRGSRHIVPDSRRAHACLFCVRCRAGSSSPPIPSFPAPEPTSPLSGVGGPCRVPLRIRLSSSLLYMFFLFARGAPGRQLRSVVNQILRTLIAIGEAQAAWPT